jgi:hypothetical protein
LTIPVLARSAILLVAVVAVRSLSAQAPIELPRVSIRFPDDSLRLPLLRPAYWPAGLFAPPALPGLAALDWRQSAERAIATARARRRASWILSPTPTMAQRVPGDTTAPAPVTPSAPSIPLPASISRYADVGVDFHTRLELKMDRLKNERCTAFDISSLTPGCQTAFPAPAIGQQFSLRAGGVVSQRVHLNVDYDTEREFTASNNINVFYQGMPGEVLQRVDIGNVTFDVPRSRFISAAVPGNSFGIQALAQAGPLEFRGVFAQQRGSSIRSRVFDIGDVATQPVDRESRDLDFEPGRFFFVVNPRNLPGYPAVDILNIQSELLPPSERVIAARVYRLRAQSGQSGTNPNLGGIQAVAVRRDSPQRVGPFTWERLVEGRDYYLDPSGAWFALATRVGTEDFLAVSYVTVSGDTVGTFPAVNRGNDILQLIYEPRRGPEVPTFYYEMRNIYRIGGGEINRASVNLGVVLNESERPLDGNGTYLGRLGLARVNDATNLDQFNRVFPRERDPNGGMPLKDLFIVLPHLRPFADSIHLDPRELNDSLYRTPTYLLATQGPAPLFHLRLHYEATGAGDRSTLNLGAFQIRDGSEKLYLGNRELVRNRDYQISYDVGMVTFLHPDSLFYGPAQVRAQFEENQNFDDAPKNNFGLATTYRVGSAGTIGVIGLYQSEQSAFTRPPLGFEPRSGMIGGINTDLTFRAAGLTRALNSLPMVRTTAPSSFSVRGELDVTRPNPNSRGQAYVEEFEGLSAFPVRLVQNNFQLGSRPSSGRGLSASYLAPDGTFSAQDAVPLIWQNAVQLGSAPIEFEPQQIDTSIVLAGATRSIETVLWMTLKPDTVGGIPDPVSGRPRWLRPHTPGPRWRSIQQSLDPSGLGVDLSRTEYLEFWVLDDADRTARSQSASLLFDFGRVFEDAIAPAPDTFRVVGADTVFSGFRLTGVGRLDTEKDSLTNSFNAAVNDLGIHADRIDSIVNGATGEIVRDLPTCQLPSGGIPSFPLGDLAADCTRHNGFADTEDLDGDNRLDVTVGVTQEDMVRYVFSFADDRYYVRDGSHYTDSAGRVRTWRLYRIPFRTDTLQINQPNVTQVRALRITLAAPNLGSQEKEFSFALARVRLVGAPWVKRAASPIAGLSGSRAQPHGEVVASIVSTETDPGYTSPPGVVNQTERVGQSLQFGSEQINEQSLRILARDLRLGERAEAFIRFTDESDKNFLKYRVLRVWARGRGPGWEDGDLDFFLKVGRDENNFYLYRVPAQSQTWDPEILVELDRWIALRTAIESSWLKGDPPHGAAQCGGDSTAYVACDGPYMVQVRDPAVSPPNLARVSEVAAGIYRRAANVAISEAELWVDDIRLSSVVSDPGMAGALDARLVAADVAEVDLTYVSRNPQFRQLGEDPTYVGNGAATLLSTLQLAKFMPQSWGLSLPLTISHVRTRDDPFYVSRTDVRADALSGLRHSEGTSTSVQATLRRSRSGQSAWEHLFLDPLSLSAATQNAGSTAELSDVTASNKQVSLAYLNPAGPRTLALPGFLSHLVASLPGWLRDSEFGRALSQARLRWNPFSVRFASLLTNNRADRTTFRVPVELASDTGIVPVSSINHVWRNEAGFDLRPFNTLIFRVDYTRTQDLQDYGDTTSMGRLLGTEHNSFLGNDAGFERARTFNTALSISPPVGRWFRPRFILSSGFTFYRDPSGGTPVQTGPDSMGAFIAPHALANSRRREFGGTADVSSLVQTFLGRSNLVARLARAIQPVDFSLARELRSSFDRAPFFADLGYQLGLGGVDDFRFQEGVNATGAADIRNRTAAGGFNLPLGLRARSIYQDLEAVNWVRRLEGQAELRQNNLEWPSGTLSWLYSPRWALSSVVTTLSAQTRYRRVVATTVQPGESPEEDARTENRSTLVNPSVTVTWVGGVLTGFQYGRTITNSFTSGNVTRSDREDWAGNLSFAFRAPSSLVRLRSPLRASMAFGISDLLVCLNQPGSSDCVTVSDSRRRQADIKLDTGFSPTITGGASFGYVLTEQRHTATRLSQVIFTVFAEINFSAGSIR